MTDTRYVTDGESGRARFVLYSICVCSGCQGAGKRLQASPIGKTGFGIAETRCSDCRGEGRMRREVASATDAESLGLALVTLAREGEWEDCTGFGLLDREGDTGKKWLINGLWLPSARNVSDAGRTLAQSKGKKP